MKDTRTFAAQMGPSEVERVDVLKEHFEHKFNITKLSSTSLFRIMLAAVEKEEFPEDSE